MVKRFDLEHYQLKTDYDTDMDIFPFLAHTGLIFMDLAILPLDKTFIDRISMTTSLSKIEYELLLKSVTQMFKKIETFIQMTPEIEIY